MGMGRIMSKKKKIMLKFLDFMQKFIDFAVMVFLCLYIFTAIVFHDKIANVFGYEFNVVQSESMKGTLNKYDFLVIIKVDASKIQQGDIIVFFDNSQNYKIVHRVCEIIETDDVFYYQTKGDNNPEVDNGYRTAEEIYGKYLFTIPYLGILITFFSSQYGLLVILLNIWNAVLIVMLWKLDKNPDYYHDNDFKQLKEKWTTL